MFLPTPSHVYMTGKCLLSNGRRLRSDRNGIIYDGMINCRDHPDHCPFVLGVFRQNVENDVAPLNNGLYNLSCKVA